MSVDVDTQPETADSAPAEQDAAPTDEALSDPLGDTLGEGGDESVQMILPPKPGVGPKVTDRFEPLDEILSDQG